VNVTGPRWRFPVLLLAVLAAALVVRLHAASQALQLPHLAKYPDAARLWLDGGLTGERLFDFSPFYLALTAALSALGLPPREALLGLQALAGVAVVGVAAGLAGRLGGWPAGLTAGALAVASRLAVVGGATLEPEVWLGLALLAGTLLLTPGDRGEHATPTVVTAAGLCFALAALVRPNALLVPLLLALFSLLPRWWNPVALLPRRGAALGAAAVAVGGLAAGLALWLGGEAPPRQWPALMSPGQVFHQGNGRDASGLGLHYPPSVAWATAAFGAGQPDFHHQAYRLVARAEESRCRTATEVEGFWRGRALAAMGERPGWAAGRLARRLVSGLSHRQVWDVTGAAELEDRLGPWTPVTLPVLLPLALVGLGFGGRRTLVLLPVMAVPLVTGGLFFGSGRHRLLLDLPLAVVAGVGVAWLAGRLTAPDGLRGWRGAAVAAALGAGIAIPFLPAPEIVLGRQLTALDQAADRLLAQTLDRWRQGEVEEAADRAAEAAVLAADTLGRLRRAQGPEVVAFPPTFRERFEARLFELAGQLVAEGEGPVVGRAAAALPPAGGCDRLAEALAARVRSGTSLPREAEVPVWIAHAGCLLRGEGSGSLEGLQRLAGEGRLPAEGYGFLAAGSYLAGATLETALAVFPPAYDRATAELSLAAALGAAGRPQERTALERAVRERIERWVGCG
jgi:hypothetical protein